MLVKLIKEGALDFYSRAFQQGHGNKATLECLAKFVIHKYGKVEYVTNIHYNTSWRWKGIMKLVHLITDQLWWQMASKNSISFRRKYLWRSIGPLPQNLQSISQLINIRTSFGDLSTVQQAYHRLMIN